VPTADALTEGDAGRLAARLAAIVDSSADAIIGATLDGIITSWNPAATAVFGYTAEEITGHSIAELVPPDRAGEPGSLLNKVRHGERVLRYETRGVRQDGTVIDVSVSVSPIPSAAGTITEAIGTVRDNTEDRRVSEAAARLAAIVESSSDAIIGKTLDGIITSWNPAATAMYGYTAGEITGHSIAELIPPDRGGELAEILDQIRQGQRVDHFETTRLRHDGTVIDVSISVSPIRDATGRITGAATIARDITDRNRSEAEMRAYQEQLSRTERLETVGQLAGGVAHDVNNMVGAIIGFAELITTETDNRAAVIQDARQILATSQRAGRLTKELLILSRRLPAQPKTINCSTLVAGMHELLAASIGSHITLRLDLADDAPDIYADPGRIEQALLNLAANARDAMPDGGTLTITTAGTHLTDQGARHVGSGVQPGHYATITVADTGTGMSREVAARAFEPFFTTKELASGTGLGLSTVHGVITQAGGAVMITTEPGSGTVFHIFIPVTAAPAVLDVPAPARPAAGAGATQTILVADDEPAVLQATTRILEYGGYATVEATTAYEALTLLISHDVQLLLTDSLMPGMSGIALAENVAHLRPGLPVLHMSGYTPPKVLDEQTTFIQKPFTAETLLGKVREMLDASPRGDRPAEIRESSP
jgi:two-component system, cell cycle sensor histidine kinase and response regulator CckA